MRGVKDREEIGKVDYQKSVTMNKAKQLIVRSTLYKKKATLSPDKAFIQLAIGYTPSTPGSVLSAHDLLNPDRLNNYFPRTCFHLSCVLAYHSLPFTQNGGSNLRLMLSILRYGAVKAVRLAPAILEVSLFSLRVHFSGTSEWF